MFEFSIYYVKITKEIDEKFYLTGQNCIIPSTDEFFNEWETKELQWAFTE